MNPRITVIGPYIRRVPVSGVEEWLPFVSGFAVVVLCAVEWYRRKCA